MVLVQISICQCQWSRARNQFPCAIARCQGHRGKPISHQNQTDALKTTKSKKANAFYDKGFLSSLVLNARYRILFHERCWGDIAQPLVQNRKKQSEANGGEPERARENRGELWRAGENRGEPGRTGESTGRTKENRGQPGIPTLPIGKSMKNQ